MKTAEKRDLIKRAAVYREGENDINNVYMGSMMTARLMFILGGSYGGGVSVNDLVDTASEEQIDKAYDYCATLIEFMLENPRSKCPTCGQIVEAT